MERKFIFIVGICGAIAVVLGAFGAHQLSNLLAEKQLSSFKTGVQYQFYHTLAMFGTALYYKQSQHQVLVKRAFMAFLIGVILFSGSLYLLSLRELIGISSWAKILGPITPIGGLAFIIGWVLLAYEATKK